MYHPVFMVIGFVLFMTNGLVSYVADYGAVRAAEDRARRPRRRGRPFLGAAPARRRCPCRRWFPPLIANLLLFVLLSPSPSPPASAVGRCASAQLEKSQDRATRRIVHGTIQFVGALFAAAGYLVVFTAHETEGRSQWAMNSPATARWHVGFGYATLFLVVGQVVVGLYKLVLRARNPPQTIAKWHGHLGLGIYSLGIASLIIAVKYWWIDLHEYPAVAGVTIAMLCVLFVLTLTETACGPRRSADQSPPAFAPLMSDEASRTTPLFASGSN